MALEVLKMEIGLVAIVARKFILRVAVDGSRSATHGPIWLGAGGRSFACSCRQNSTTTLGAHNRHWSPVLSLQGRQLRGLLSLLLLQLVVLLGRVLVLPGARLLPIVHGAAKRVGAQVRQRNGWVAVGSARVHGVVS